MCDLQQVSACGLGHGREIAQYRKLWLQLYRLTRNLGLSMGLTFGGHVVMYFTMQVLIIYYTISKATKVQTDALVLCSMPLMLTVFIFAHCNSAHTACQEVKPDLIPMYILRYPRQLKSKKMLLFCVQCH